MSIVLTINAATAEELVSQIKGLQAALVGQVLVMNESGTVEKRESAPTIEKPKATRTAKAKENVAETKVEAPKAEETQTDAAQTTIESAVQGTKTKEDVATALQTLTAAKDIETAKRVLAQFKNKDGNPSARMSDLLEKDYEDFISTCEAESK